MKLNTKLPQVHTHEGATAARGTPEQQLRRSVMACMLWENEFYESGVAIADRVAALVPTVKPETVQAIAIEARERMKLRHAPLHLARAMCRLPEHKRVVAATLERIIQRPDELTEFLAIYWANNDGKRTLSAQAKKGLARAFGKFNEYALAKYDRAGAVKLRDALFLSHAKPPGVTLRRTRIHRQLERSAGIVPDLTPSEALYAKVVDRTLATPDTWEVALSAIPKTDTEAVRAEWSRLLVDNRLGALALLRNLRNMHEAGVSVELVRGALASMATDRVLPFRFIAAARVVPQWEDMIEPAMLGALDATEKLDGETVLLVDVSGSMDAPLSAKSDMRRVDAACGLAILLREVCASVRVATFSDALVNVPPRRGFALRDAILTSQPHQSTMLGAALAAVAPGNKRTIVITDEQTHDRVPAPPAGCLGYIINVASAKYGVGYGAWTHVDGWSEAVVDYVRASELPF